MASTPTPSEAAPVVVAASPDVVLPSNATLTTNGGGDGFGSSTIMIVVVVSSGIIGLLILGFLAARFSLVTKIRIFLGRFIRPPPKTTEATPFQATITETLAQEHSIRFGDDCDGGGDLQNVPASAVVAAPSVLLPDYRGPYQQLTQRHQQQQQQRATSATTVPEPISIATPLQSPPTSSLRTSIDSVETVTNSPQPRPQQQQPQPRRPESPPPAESYEASLRPRQSHTSLPRSGGARTVRSNSTSTANKRVSMSTSFVAAAAASSSSIKRMSSQGFGLAPRRKDSGRSRDNNSNNNNGNDSDIDGDHDEEQERGVPAWVRIATSSTATVDESRLARDINLDAELHNRIRDVQSRSTPPPPHPASNDDEHDIANPVVAPVIRAIASSSSLRTPVMTRTVTTTSTSSADGRSQQQQQQLVITRRVSSPIDHSQQAHLAASLSMQQHQRELRAATSMTSLASAASTSLNGDGKKRARSFMRWGGGGGGGERRASAAGLEDGAAGYDGWKVIASIGDIHVGPPPSFEESVHGAGRGS